MQGLMQEFPLTLPMIVRRAETLFADSEIVTASPGGLERTTYGAWAERAHRLGGVLDDLGVSADGRVATFGWNTARHLECYYAAPCTGRVLHTLNIRLFADQLTYIVNHAEDEVVFVDRSLLPLLWPLVPTFETVKHFVVMDDGSDCEIPDDPRIRDYETLLAAASPVEFDVDDENSAAAMCYTSGTTGNPKGVVYSHRAMVLHAMASMATDLMGVCQNDTVLAIVPMFHANVWGLAHSALMAGANVIFPGPDLTAPAIVDHIERERVTLAAGVPTIWMAVLPELKGRDMSSLRIVVCGGSAVPKALSEGYREAIGLPITQAWGMTETGPLGSWCIPKKKFRGASDEEMAELRTAQGLAVPGVEVRIADADTGEILPWDGESRGELQCHGPWIAASYYNDPRSGESFTKDGWLRTGDVATIDADGYIRLRDRTKDLVKSGGEWISSVELENEIMSHPKVLEAAVIGVPHDKWVERPLACVVVKPGETLTAEEVLDHLRPRVAKWWMPDAVEFIDAVPKTSVGKFSKKDLRAKFEGYTLADHEA